jgi:Ni,Fe-hydrogenase I cytochrome b subunit
MKNTKKNSYAMDDYKWYLVLDGKTTKVVSSNHIAEYEAMTVVVVEVTASQAAAILLLNQTYKAD